LPPDRAFEILREGAGTHFDPDYAHAFIVLRPRLEQLLRERGAFTETISKQELQQLVEAARRPPSPLPDRPIVV